MFEKLRRQFIITTMSIVSIVLVISFVAIYVSTANTLYREPRQPASGPSIIRAPRFDGEIRAYINEQRREFAEASLQRLLLILLATGAITLTIVYFISRYMADRAVGAIENAYEKQRQFIADASHELKTPIAVITTNAEAALSDDKKPSKWLKNIKHESDRMGKLVNDLLSLAKLDNKVDQITMTNFDVSETIIEVMDSFEPLAKKKKVAFTHHLEQPLKIHSDEDKIRQLLAILVDNAVKYTESNGEINVSLTISENHAIVSVVNTYKQASKVEIEKFFDRFYQADASHRNEGHGLGLSIAKNLADQLGASLEAMSSKDSIEFRLILPV